jgi:hypothetical protein
MLVYPTKDFMTELCIHGFSTEQCASCRTCPHGLISNRCGRCVATAARSARRKPSAMAEADASNSEHQGFEIVYVPAVTGWQVRGPGIEESESYRSVFLARRAIDKLASQPTAKGSKRSA